MSLKIYTDLVVVPSRLTALVKLLIEDGPLTKDELLVRLQPRKEPTTAASTLSAAIELGLAVETATKELEVPTAIRAKLGSTRQVAENLPGVLASIILAPQIGDKANAFALICAWFFLLSHADIPAKKGDLLTQLERDGLSLSELQARNSAGWDNIFYWARYLGLLYQYGGSKADLILPDPTRFIVGSLDALFSAKERISSDELLRRLGAICPVLDGGEVRRALVDRIQPDAPRHSLSDGLSLALLRLEHQGVLRLESVEDAATFHTFAGDRRLTHVQRVA